ncbi:hypothetical protein [Streptomyces sp. CC77]|uniref:hypothetical protein n=1 Tax=Streptomyces sp. CC77 TaxID=1906739 RepID=UPI0008DDBCFC|nr:hypothetical protein [Streptomyces sp. CC77]OII68304.1 hypothetical protein BJP39_00665 [Streptomyces sp. CC77]
MTSTTTHRIGHPAVLDELPAGTEIRDADGDTGTKTDDGAWEVIGFPVALDSDWFTFPVEVVNPTPETALLVADITGPHRLPDLMVELRSVVADIRELYARQERQLDELRDEDGDVPSGNLQRWDELRYDIHMEEGSDQLGAVLRRLERLVDPEGGE